jgi:hypothetical protein
MSLPKPTQLKSYSPKVVYGSIYETGHSFKIKDGLIQESESYVFKIPSSFKKKCRKEILSHSKTVCSWFKELNQDELERHIRIPSEHREERINEPTHIKMDGILIASQFIYPKLSFTMDTTPSVPSLELNDGLVEIKDSELKFESENFRITTEEDDFEEVYDDEDEDDDEDEGEDDEDEEHDMRESIRRIQDTIDRAREDLAKLARKHNAH